MTTTRGKGRRGPTPPGDGDRLAPVAAVVRVWWVMGYRAWSEATTGATSHYGRGPLPKWDGGVDADGRRHKSPVWPRVAAHCLQHGLGPERLIRAYFRGCGVGTHPVPTHLLGDAARARYDEYEEDTALELRSALRMMNHALDGVTVFCKLNGRADVTGEIVRALHSGARSMSALFRHCALLRHAPAEAAAYADAALVQYVFDRDAYDAAWGDFIPESLRRDAARLHDQIRRGART